MKYVILPHDHGHLPDRLQTWMPTGDTFEIVAEVLKLLDDGKRVQLFWILCHCEECVMNLSALMQMGSSSVSHHLKILRDAGFVVSRREGKEVYYTAAGTDRAKILHEMIERVAELSCPAKTPEAEPQEYDSNIRTITGIHDFLTEHLEKRYTVEELSQRFLINPTTLKKTFRTVYGQPIARYMKERRIQRARELLERTEMSVAEIAVKVGYENQSKFTQAFHEATGLLPREYRRLPTSVGGKTPEAGL